MFSKQMTYTVVAALALLASSAAVAKDWDGSDILDSIAAYSAIAVGLAAAIIAALWVMRVLGLLKPKH